MTRTHSTVGSPVTKTKKQQKKLNKHIYQKIQNSSFTTSKTRAFLFFIYNDFYTYKEKSLPKNSKFTTCKQ